jgi:hypothetical protein
MCGDIAEMLIPMPGDMASVWEDPNARNESIWVVVGRQQSKLFDWLETPSGLTLYSAYVRAHARARNH